MDEFLQFIELPTSFTSNNWVNVFVLVAALAVVRYTFKKVYNKFQGTNTEIGKTIINAMDNVTKWRLVGSDEIVYTNSACKAVITVRSDNHLYVMLNNNWIEVRRAGILSRKDKRDIDRKDVVLRCALINSNGAEMVTNLSKVLN